jgi:hypothetical protein
VKEADSVVASAEEAVVVATGVPSVVVAVS